MLQMRVLLCVVCASLLWQSCGADDAPTPAAQPLRMTPGMLAAVLQGSVSGSVVTPTTALYGQERGEALNRSLSGYCASPFANEYGQLPVMLLQPKTVQDISSAVRFAQSYGLPVGIKGGAHSTRNLWNVKDGVTISMGANFHDVTVDSDAKVAVVQGGATYAAISDATAPHGLALPWGTAYQPGMGLALHGGLGLLTRAYGLTSDNLINATIVTANGSVINVNETSRPDLLPVLRGAGSALGVVVQAAFQLHDITDFYGGALTLEDDAAGDNYRTAWNWSMKAVAEVPELGVEVVKATTWKGSPIIQVLVAYPGNTSSEKKAAIFEPLAELGPVIQNGIGDMDYFETEMVDTNSSILVNYGVNYILGATVSFDQVDNDFLQLLNVTANEDLLPNMTTRIVSNILGNSVAKNAIVKGENASFTPFSASDVDAHVYVLYAWPANSTSNSDYLKVVETKRDNLAKNVLAVQPYVNLATFNKDSNLSVQLGSDANVKALRAVKTELDAANTFPNHPFAGLYQPPLNTSSPIFATAG